MIKFVLIGGKKNKEILTNNIEKYIINLSGKNNPKILFCPYATSDYKKTNLKFKNLINNLSADVYYMDENDINNFDKLLNEADILYIGGGVSDDLISLFKEKELDKILYKYLNTNKIYAGSSAGAMLYCKACMGDKDMYTDNFHNYNYKMVMGLGILNLSICPHYQNEDLIIYNDEIKNYNVKSFGIEEDTCLIYDNDKFYVIKDKNNMSLYYFDNNKNYLMIPLRKGEIYE